MSRLLLTHSLPLGHDASSKHGQAQQRVSKARRGAPLRGGRAGECPGHHAWPGHNRFAWLLGRCSAAQLPPIPRLLTVRAAYVVVASQTSADCTAGATGRGLRAAHASKGRRAQGCSVGSVGQVWNSAAGQAPGHDTGVWCAGCKSAPGSQSIVRFTVCIFATELATQTAAVAAVAAAAAAAAAAA